MLYKDIKTNRCKYFRKKCSKKCNWNGKSVILRVCDGVKREMNNRRYTCEILYTSKQSHNVTHREVQSNRITKLLVLKGLRINKQQNKKKCCCFNKIRILKKSTNVMNTPRQLKVGLQISWEKNLAKGTIKLMKLNSLVSCMTSSSGGEKILTP